LPKLAAFTSKGLSLALLMALCVILPAAGQTSDSIPWNADRPLVWADFQCTPPADAIHRNEPAAIHMTIHWRVSYSASSATGSTWMGRVGNTEVTNVMSPKLSWAVPGKVDALILLHEQAHFDLNEVYRRKVERALLCVQAQGVSQQGVLDALKAQVHNVANALLNRLVEVQAQYDDETQHGVNRAMQVHWQEQIARWLLDPAGAPS